jgi:hypothetical protein
MPEAANVYNKQIDSPFNPPPYPFDMPRLRSAQVARGPGRGLRGGLLRN